ncbi:MAG TPA: hypothetical protein VK525_19585 [Candidatus Saccharimonadales bacterium]|jgi:hypothetical protein|nr:hypothetical protein [Candidatus Saccharimonadales bacterium]
MELSKRLLKSVLGKAAVATMALGGFLIFAGAPGAQARPVGYYRHPVVRYAHPIGRTVVVNRYYGPRADYWRFHRHEVIVHGWRDRYGYWHRY